MQVSAGVMGFLGRAELILEADDCRGSATALLGCSQGTATGAAPQDTLRAPSVKRH